MQILVLGGTVFLGRAVVSEALAAGHQVTTFSRGVSGEPPAGAEALHGDRTDIGDLAQLKGRPFDLVVDTSGYVPAEVVLSADVLAPTCGHYAFVSTINVFPGWPEQPDYRAGGLHSGDPDATRDDVPDDADPGAAYGLLKAGCEQSVVRAFGPDRSSVLRAGMIVGPDDSVVGRLPWWLDRVARGGEVLVPGAREAEIRMIDSRDLADFALARVPGSFETSGPAGQTTRAEFMRLCREVTGSDATFTYVDDAWLAGQGVEGWTEVPIWLSPDEGPSLFGHDTREAEAAGLRFRPVLQTLSDTWAWQQSVPGGWHATSRTPGLQPERERELLAAWHAGEGRSR